MTRFGLPRASRVRKRGAFVEIQRDGKKRSSSTLLVLTHAQRLPGAPRLGLTVSSRVGGAVVRNRVKRRLREVFRQHPDWFSPGMDYVLIARPSSARQPYATLCEEIRRLCVRSPR